MTTVSGMVVMYRPVDKSNLVAIINITNKCISFEIYEIIEMSSERHYTVTVSHGRETKSILMDEIMIVVFLFLIGDDDD